jgi:hypothetical protein
MPPKLLGKRPPGRPSNPEKSVEISLKVQPDFAATLAEMAEGHGVIGHTAAAQQILTLAVQAHRRKARKTGR